MQLGLFLGSNCICPVGLVTILEVYGLRSHSVTALKLEIGCQELAIAESLQSSRFKLPSALIGCDAARRLDMLSHQ